MGVNVYKIKIVKHDIFLLRRISHKQVITFFFIISKHVVINS